MGFRDNPSGVKDQVTRWFDFGRTMAFSPSDVETPARSTYADTPIGERNLINDTPQNVTSEP